MLVVKVELWPGGSEDGARELSRILIVNDGTGSRVWGWYGVG